MSRMAIVLLLAVPLHAQTIEERLARLEEEVRALRAENAALRSRIDAGASVTPPASSEPENTRLNFGGFIQAQAESGGAIDSRFDGVNDRVYLRRTRLNATGALPQDFDFRVEIDMSGSLSNGGGLRAQLTDAFINWSPHRSARIRVGQFKTPFGAEQLISDTVLITPERSLANDRLTLGRQLGIQVGGNVGSATYALGVFNGTGTNTTLNDNDAFLAVGRVASAIGPVAVGVNAYRSDDDEVAMASDFNLPGNFLRGTRTGWGADARYAWGRAEWVAEYIHADFEPRDAAGTRQFSSAGWFAHAAWFFVPQKLQGLVRYETFDPSSRFSGDTTGTWAVGTNYYLRGNDLKLQLYYYASDHDENRFIARLQTVF